MSVIAAIYGLERSGATTALVMELVEGPTLADLIVRRAGPIGPAGLPLDEALAIAKQIADALEAAHEKGIIHRDLKPANVKVRPDGTVKVLDFGLAKAMDNVGRVLGPADGAGSKDPAYVAFSQSPTITTPAMTQAGMILGTAAYMSPEQARGKTVDRRADVWAFGAVLFEMLTGKRAFTGGEVSEVLASVLAREPDWTLLPRGLSSVLGTYIRRCLRKDPKQRIPDIAAMRLALEGAFETAAPQTTTPAPAIQPRPRWKRAIPIVVTAMVVSAMVGAAAWTLKPTPPLTVTRFAFALGEGQQFTNTGRRMVTISPDGTRIVYVANNRLHLRSMSDVDARPIPGTESAQGVTNPTFSPDGRSIAFWSGADSTLKTVAVSGGAPVTIGPAGSNPLGMSWDASGIVFSQPDKGIVRLSANGGQSEVLVGLKDGEVMYGPQVLPGGEWVLFTLATGAPPDWDRAQIVVQSLKSSERKTLVSGGKDGRYLPTGLDSPKRAEREGGHIVYALGGVVFAVPFDLRQVAVTGGPVPIVEGVQIGTGNVDTTSGVAQFSVSRTGSLVFVPGPVSARTAAQLSVGLFDRKGEFQVLKIQPGPYRVPRMSPDGKRVALGSDDGKDASVWIYDLSGASAMRRLTYEGQGHNRFPVWSSDSQRVAFQSDREGDLGIFWQRADGSGTAERLTKADEGTSHIPESWAPDGERFLYNAGKGGATALWVLSLKDKTAVRFEAVESPATTLTGAVFSPDGRWVAYASREGRRSSAVYVQPFPPTGAKYQISRNADDGHHPMWSPDGTELWFNPAPGPVLNAVRVTTQPGFTFGDATPLTTPFQKAAPQVERPYDISRDGQHFLGLVFAAEIQTGGPAAPQIQVVLNWFEELKAKVPTN